MPSTLFTPPFANQRLIDYSEVDRSIGNLCNATVATYPNRVILETEEGHLTFAELNAEANAVAHGLLRHLKGFGERVCLWMPDTMEQVCAVVGVWKAGKVLVSNDPHAPAAYNVSIVNEAGPSLLITVAEYLQEALSVVSDSCNVLLYEDLVRGMQRSNPEVIIEPEQTATLIFTSGSTGVPKAVVLSHRYMVSQAIVYANSNGLTHEDVRLFINPLTHVNGPALVSSAIICGYQLSYYPLRKYGVSHLAAWIREKKITAYSSVPTVFRYFLSTAGDELDLSSIRFVHLGGERVLKSDVELFQRHFREDCVLCVNIGSSEAGGISRYYIDKHMVLEDDEVPVGLAYPFKEVLILDEGGHPVPQGCEGEIVVKSPNLADGYFNQPEETARRFVVCQDDPSQRLYFSGDIGRIREDGCLIYLGRRDHQIKVNGHRVEIGEIESCLSLHPGVDQCAVQALDDPQRGVKLVAYVQAKVGVEVDASDLRRWVDDRLVYYKRPRAWVLMDKFPMLSSGKLNRNALPEPPDNSAIARPENPDEQAILNIWTHIFGREDISCEDSFFALGGDSMQLISLADALGEYLHRDVGQNLLFKYTTIRQQALHLMGETGCESNIIPMTGEGSSHPLFIIHGWEGTVFQWVELAYMLDLDRPVFGVQGNEFRSGVERHASVEILAKDYARQIASSGIKGPIDLAGYSLGGMFAFAVAHQLTVLGCEVGSIFIVDTQPRNLPRRVHYRVIAPYMMDRLNSHLRSFLRKHGNRNIGFVRERWAAFRAKIKTGTSQASQKRVLDPAGDYYHELSKYYVPQPLDCRIVLIKFGETRSDLEVAWRYLSRNPVKTFHVEGDHLDLLKSEFLKSFAPVFSEALLSQA